MPNQAPIRLGECGRERQWEEHLAWSQETELYFFTYKMGQVDSIPCKNAPVVDNCKDFLTLLLLIR